MHQYLPTMTSTTTDKIYSQSFEKGSPSASKLQELSPWFKHEKNTSLTFKELLTQFVCTNNAHPLASAAMKPQENAPLSSVPSSVPRLAVGKQTSTKCNAQSGQDIDHEAGPPKNETHPPPQSSSKRKVPAAPKSNRPSKKQRNNTIESPKRAMIPAGSADNKLVDSLCPGLLLVIVGVNPSIETGKTGHAYSHPTNKFWRLLHESNITPIRHKPQDTHSLMNLYGIGHTNMVSAASVAEKDIPKAVYQAGVAVLDEKMRALKPQAVAFVGKNVWENWFQYKTGRRFNGKKDTFEYGWQEEEMQVGRTLTMDSDMNVREIHWAGARTFVLPTSSAACAFWNKDGVDTRIEFWKPLGQWFAPKRLEWVEARESREEVELVGVS